MQRKSAYKCRVRECPRGTEYPWISRLCKHHGALWDEDKHLLGMIDGVPENAYELFLKHAPHLR